MRKIYSIFKKIEEENPINIIFDLPDIISTKNISNHEKLSNNISNTSQYFGTGRYDYNISIGKEFDVIFSREKPQEYIKVKSILKYVNVKPSIQLDYLPAGYSGVCLIDFPDGKPNILSKLSEFKGDNSNKSKDILYLTTQDIMDNILILLDES